MINKSTFRCFFLIINAYSDYENISEEIIKNEVLKYAEYMRFYQSLDASDYYRLNSYDMYIDRTMFLNYLQTYGEIAGDKKAEEMLMQLVIII